MQALSAESDFKTGHTPPPTSQNHCSHQSKSMRVQPHVAAQALPVSLEEIENLQSLHAFCCYPNRLHVITFSLAVKGLDCSIWINFTLFWLMF